MVQTFISTPNNLILMVMEGEARSPWRGKVYNIYEPALCRIEQGDVRAPNFFEKNGDDAEIGDDAEKGDYVKTDAER